MNSLIDLHTHSTASDGTLTPTELLSLAKEQHLKAIALTDHDTTAGLEEAEQAAIKNHIELVSGIEFSSTWKNTSVHIVGLDFNWKNAGFQEALAKFQSSRTRRNIKMIALLQKEGFHISMESVQNAFPNSTCTRANLARFLVDNGEIPSMREAFDRYLGDHAKCYVPREEVTPAQTIDLIHQCGGIAVFAHPVLCRFSMPRLEELILELKKSNLDALEVFYSTYTHSDQTSMARLAEKYQLKSSGGSDFHGSNKPLIHLGTGKGNLKIPYTVLESLRS